MATYDVTKNKCTWAQGAVLSFEVQCKYTDLTAQADSELANLVPAFGITTYGTPKSKYFEYCTPARI